MNSTDFASEVRSALKDIISRRRDVTILAARQRSKFEHWLKFELASALSRDTAVQNVRLEEPFPNAGGRCDIFAEFNHSEWYIELKTANTSWRAEGIENRTRPITSNVKEIISDIAKLKKSCPSAKRIAAFVLFPVPTRIWQQERKWLNHQLTRIEHESYLVDGTLLSKAGFVALDPGFGMAVFVVEVV